MPPILSIRNATPARPNPAGYEHFDESTGQVFREAKVPVRSMVQTWMHTSRGRKDNPSTYRYAGRGASPLLNMALRTCAWNIDYFEPEALKWAEWSYAKKIYRHLKKRDTLTLHAWGIFHAAFPTLEEIEHSYGVYLHGRQSNTPLQLDSIQKQLSSFSFPHLTFLNVRNLRLNTTHLMDLLSFLHLAVLVLEQDPYDIEGEIRDRFMVRWGLSVVEKGAFKKLRVLVWKHFPTSLEDTFAGFKLFPALELCNVDSRYMKRDLKAVKSGYVLRSGWHCLSNKRRTRDARINIKDHQDPETIWRRTDVTIHDKMRMLYGLAGSFLPSPSEGDSGIASISVQYGEENHINDPTSQSAWFVRRRSSEDEVKQTTKRPASSSGGPGAGKKTDSNKMRKMRDGKQKDIGDLLGLFG